MQLIKNALLFSCLLITSSLLAQDFNYPRFGTDVTDNTAPRGLERGTKAPNFEGVDQNGNTVNLAKLLKNGPVVILFYRGDWCTVCNRYLSRFQDSLSLIEKSGAQLVAITPETAENAINTVEKTKTPFTIISDTNEQIMVDYDVLFKVTESYVERIRTRLNADIAKNNGQEEAKLPVPSTYIIDQNGIIVWKHFDPNYGNRASVQDILNNLPDE